MQKHYIVCLILSLGALNQVVTILRDMLKAKYGVTCQARFRQVFRWAGGRPVDGLSPVVVVFNSQSDLEKLWASMKGNLRGDVAYQFYGVIQIYPGVGEFRQPGKLQDQFGEI